MRKTKKLLATFLSLAMIFSACSAVGLVKAAAGDYAGMVLNFETGTRDTATGTHPGYEAYYGKPGDAAIGSATRIKGMNVGYVYDEGSKIGHNDSDGAMRFSYTANANHSGNAAFSTAHTGTNANSLANFRPQFGQMFKATVWYKVESITADAKLNFYIRSGYTGITSGINLQYEGTYGGTNFADLTSADVEKGWQQASVTFMGGGTSTATQSGYGCVGYVELVMSDNLNRVGTVVYVDDITIEHIGEAIEVKYDANGGTISGDTAQYGLSGDALTGAAVRDDAEFLGWYTDKNFTQPITAIPEQSCTVYAKWKVLSYAGMKLNFETGTQDTATGTHPGYEAYYGKSGDAANGNATRVSGFDVGYVNSEGMGHNSNGAMRLAYSANSGNVQNSTHAAFNTAHTGTNANTLVNYRPYYGQMFRATVWYKVESITTDAKLNFYTNSNYSDTTNGVNLQYSGTYGGTTFAELTSADVEKGWQQASVTFMGGGSSTAAQSGSGSAGYIELMMSDDTNRVGTVVYVDDITIEHVGEAVEVKYNANGGTISGKDAQYGLAGDILTGAAEREGYEFAGWYADKDLTQPITVIPETNCTVYANWKNIKGDINGDGFLDSEDIVLLRKFLLGIIVAENELYNVNGDETVDIRDLVHLKKLIVSADARVLFIGDSIAAGWRDDNNGGAYMNSSQVAGGRGWSKRLSESDSVKATNASIAGASFTKINNRNRIVDQLHSNKESKYDYVIIEGGFNDAMGENSKPAAAATAAVVGKVSDSFVVSDFDTSTFAGAFEETLYYAKQYFPNAKLGFIITYSTPLSEYGGHTADIEKMAEYWNVSKEICDKWGISYLDLFSGTSSDGKSYSNDILKTSETTYFPGNGDCIHLNSTGYDVISPYISEWYKKIK